MVEAAYSTLREVGYRPFHGASWWAVGKGDDMIIERLKAAKVPGYLVVNKIDKAHPISLAQIDDFRQQMDSKKSRWICTAVAQMPAWLTSSVRIWRKVSRYFPEDQIATSSERFLGETGESADVDGRNLLSRSS